MFPSSLLCSSFVEGETKDAFCFSNVFAYVIYLPNEEKTSEKNTQF